MEPGPLDRYAYLGPEATFTEAALLQLPEAHDAERVPVANVPLALEAVRDGEVTGAVVPIESSVEGGVSATLDSLMDGVPLQIVREMLVPVSFVLAARPGTTIASIRRYATHPHAEAQIRGFAARELPGAAYVPASSTAASAAGLASTGDGAAEYDAAVCAPLAAERYGLEILAEDIGDLRNAVTRFVLVTRPGPIPEPTGADKTTIVAGLRSNRPGALLELLEQFAVRGVNLSRIESRPTGDGLGLYQFALDADGHVGESRIAEALAGVHRTARTVRFLGSYPRSDQHAAPIASENTDEAFSLAADWLADIRNR